MSRSIGEQERFPETLDGCRPAVDGVAAFVRDGDVHHHLPDRLALSTFEDRPVDEQTEAVQADGWGGN